MSLGVPFFKCETGGNRVAYLAGGDASQKRKPISVQRRIQWSSHDAFPISRFLQQQFQSSSLCTFCNSQFTELLDEGVRGHVSY